VPRAQIWSVCRIKSFQFLVIDTKKRGLSLVTFHRNTSCRVQLRIVFCAALLVWAGTTLAAKPVVVVTPLETQRYSLGRQADTAHAYIEDALVNSGAASVVDRKRMDAMVQELGFGNYSGLADPGKAARFGKMLGAHFLVQGTLMDLREETREFSGYGVDTRNTITSAAVRVRVMALESSEIVFSRIFNGSKTEAQTNSGGQSVGDAPGAAVRDALQKLVADANFRGVFERFTPPGAQPEISVAVSCTNNPCDLELNGVYVGSTPTEIALPAGNTADIRISKAGFQAWNKRVQPREGMQINVELAPAAPSG